MSTLDQSIIWEELACHEDMASLEKAVLNPFEFQIALKQLLDSLYRENSKIIEAGCFTGVTSLLLDDRFDKTLLDLSKSALELSEELFRRFHKTGTFIAGDMFNMPFADDSFDIVFNSGVLEHYEHKERVAALKEYGRILKPDGVMVVAVPNHYSLPYRLGYCYLNARRQWPFPHEKKLYDLGKEIREAGLSLVGRRVVDYTTPLKYLASVRLIGRPLRHVFRMTGFEGYLAVVTARKGA